MFSRNGKDIWRPRETGGHTFNKGCELAVRNRDCQELEKQPSLALVYFASRH